MKNLSKLLRMMGLPVPRNPDRRTLQNLLASVEGSEQSLAVNLAVLRSFEKAQYAPLHIGHYALASTHYCHFTSPIRRYADLLVHRLLQCHLEGRTDAAKRMAVAQDLAETGRHITFTEQRAEDAERELVTVLILQMLSKRIGDELGCVVTGLTGFGVFVQCQKFGVEGLIKLEDLGPDHWQYDKKHQCIMGGNSGQTVRLGQPLRVNVAAVNVPARQLSLTPVEPLGQAPRPTHKPRRGDKRKNKK
jgi:ribonuclease R